ncbi:MAG: hypothetical protein FWD29_09330, partial [Micrococcales bacterium]|nr:hypothetical protein [Micrococcales bacterium]
MNTSPAHSSSVSTDVRRRFGRLVRPVTLLVAAAIGLGGLSVAQSWMGRQQAQASDGTISWNATLWAGATQFNKDWLYSAYNTSGWAIKDPKAATATAAGYTEPAWNATGWNNGGAPTTMAIGPERDSAGQMTGRLVGYLWAWGGTTQAGGGNAVSVRKVVPNDTVAKEFFVSWNRFTGGNNWSGGEVFQGTGELYLSPAEGNDVRNISDPTTFGTSAQLEVCKPWEQNASLRATCRQSRMLYPATPNDQLAAANGTVSTTALWNIGSDMALDAEGNAYLLASNGGLTYLIKVKPGADGENWYWQKVLRFNNQLGVDTYWGMAFHDGLIYARFGSGALVVMNPLTKQMSRGGFTVQDFRDLASAQTAGTFRGTIFNDLNGDGVRDSGEPVLPNVTVELYKQGQSGPVSTQETDGLGEYNFILDATANVEWYVRVKQPTIDGYNARQTYAGGYSSKIDQDGNYQRGTANVVTPRCSGNAMAAGYEGPCLGARTDGIDPSAQMGADNVFTDTGALIVTKATSTTSDELSVADFGLSIYGSYGDAPATFKSTRAQGGPLLFPTTVQGNARIGATAGQYGDGINDPGANAHLTDDGVEYKDSGPGTVWAPLQDQILAVGRSYDFRIKVEGLNAASAYAKAWFGEMNVAAAGTTFTTTPRIGDTAANATPAADGYVYRNNYIVGSVQPTGGLQNMFIRAEAGLDWASLSPEKPAAATDWNTTPWVQTGEVEDYRMGIANATVQLQARTVAGVSSTFDYTLTNVINTAPSSTSDSITTSADGAWQPSRQGHAITTPGSPVDITTTSIPDGWRLGTRVDAAGAPIDTYCMDPITGVPVAYTVVSPTELRLDGTATGVGSSVVCRLTYMPVVDMKTSSITTDPEPDSSTPLKVTVTGTAGGTYSITAKLQGTVTDAGGASILSPVPGQGVEMTIAPDGNGATATGASFANDLQADTCVTDANGECTLVVKGLVPGTYSITARTDVNGTATTFSTVDSPPANRHPALTYFEANEQCMPPPSDAFTLNNTGLRLSNSSDFRSALIKLRDCGDNPITGKVADLSISVTRGGSTLTQGTDYWIDNLEETAAGSGDYSFSIRSARDGDLQVTVTFNDKGTPKVLGTQTATFDDNTVICVKGTNDPRCTEYSDFTITPKTPTPYADWQFASKSPSDWGFYEGVITLVGFNASPITDGIGRITMSDVTTAPAPLSGARFWSTATNPPLTGPGNATAVTCSVALVGTSCPTGVYNIRIYSTIADTRQIKAAATQTGSGAVDIDTQPATFDPWSDPVHNQTRLTVNPAGDSGLLPNGTAAYVVTATVFDENNLNALQGEDVTFSIAKSTATPDAGGATMRSGSTTLNPAGEVLTTSSAGQAQVTVTAVAPEGDYVITAMYNAGHVGAARTDNDKSPQTLTFRTGDDPDLSLSTVRVSPDDIIANDTDTGTITVLMIDQNGLPMTGRGARLSAQGPTGVALNFSAFTPTSTAGEYSATVRGTDAGDHKITVSYSGTELTTLATPNPNDVAHFVEDEPDVLNSTLSIQPCVAISPSHPVVVADAADCFRITAVLRDHYLNPVRNWYSPTAAANNYFFDSVPPGAIMSTPQQTPAGTYTIEVRSNDIETYALTFYFRAAGPNRVTLTPTLTAEFGSDTWEITKSHFTATPAPPAETVVGKSGALITLRAFNAANQPVDLTDADLLALSARADRAGGGSATIGNWTRTALGVYTAT